MKVIPARGERLLPLLSGVLLALSFPPFSLLFPPFIALAPLFVFVWTRPAGPAGRRAAGRAGFLAGLVYFGLLLYWLIVALIYYSKLAIPAYVLTVIVLGLFTSLVTSGMHFLRDRVGVRLAIAGPVLWTTLEWVQGHLGDLSFPWLGLGSSLAAYPILAGAADLVGARGLTFVLALVNALVAEAVIAGGRVPGVESGAATSPRPRAWLRPALAAGAIVVALGAYGLVRAKTLELVPAARVAVVQPNIPEDLKMDPAAGRDSSWTALRNLSGSIEPGSVDLVAWPEVSLTVALRKAYAVPMRRTIERMSQGSGATYLVGAYDEDDAGTSPVFFNSAFVVRPDVGLEREAYSKRFLVPFVERIPFIDPAWFESIVGDMQYFGGLGKGEGLQTFEAGGARFGVLICYESIFTQLARDLRREGADFLVNITNDAWYGREPWWARTSALWQHPSHLPMRAIENRVGIARAANTGISMFVDPLGHTHQRTDLFTPAVRTEMVYTTSGLTVYARLGDWLATMAAAAAAVLLLWARFGTRDREDVRAG